jgi:hypothetical protein
MLFTDLDGTSLHYVSSFEEECNVCDYNYLHQQMHNYFFIKHTPHLHVSTHLVIIRAFTRYQGTKMRLKYFKYLYIYIYR